ncbi:Metastasis suppressor protein [Schistosoma japonicum]|uniref:Metastasis suppressor protein n=1 Tax=Schistosoma japonicum TaxID=6182 RepID=A0A4Z2DI04_SCHJA|nr:Metastasis suppressor protein [Schistosoma japonicum]
MRQKSLESKVKSMSNHLVTSLANPLSLKVDEWKRNLYQLEKDRTRQTKRARAELKKALCEAHKWEKKAAKIGTTGNIGVGPGVGHGIIPSTNVTCSNSESNAVNVQAAKAQCEVGLKKELVENTEKSAIRLLLLEERSRFCFFVSCLIPILECQSSMLNEIATIDELIKILTKETEYPDQLVEDVESIVLRMGLRDISVSSRNGSKIMSVFVPDNGDRVNNMNEVIGSLFITNGNRSCTNSSDTESGRHGSDMVSPYRICRDSNTVGRCNSVCDSADISLCGASSNSGSGGSNCPSLLSPVRSNVAHLGSRESSLISVDSATSGSGNTNSAYSIGLSNTNIPHSDPEETQFKTLCRPGHCRAASNGDNGDFPIYLKNGFHHDKTDSVIAKSMIAFNAQSKLIDGQNYSIKRNDDIENVKRDKSENKLSVNTEDEDHDGDDDDDDGEDGGEYVEVGSDSGSKLGYLSNNHTSPSLSNSMNQHFSLESCPSSSVTTATTGDPPIPNNGRHTISSAYERGIHAPARASITALSFNSPVGKTASKDSGVDSSAVLYPKQAVPPPVYTNLIQLAHAAQRKFSMSQLPIVHSYENVDNNALDRLRYDKIDMNSCQQFSNPHHSPNRNSISMNPQQYHQLTNVSPNTATSNNYNWSVSGSLNKLHLNDSGKSQTNSDEKYVKPSSGLKSPVEKLTSSTSLSSSCFGSKNCLDNVSTSDVTAASTTVVSNNGIHSYQRSGTDPFSLEMDELDQVMPGSSRGSSITMASSTTNDSLPSSNGSPALLGYHATSNINNNNTRKSISFNQNSLNNEQALENKSHYATPVIKNSSYQCSAAAGQVSSLLKQSSLVSNPVCMNNELTNPQTVYETKDVSDRIATTPPPPPPPPPLPIFPSPSLSTNSSIIPHSSLVEIAPAKSDCAENPSTNLVSVETANLMSELSSQLQQLAARTNDINFSPSKSNFKTNNAFSHHKECIKHNEFDLPPPPPSSMFTEQYCSGVVKSDCPSIRTTNISSTSSKSTVNNPGEEIIDDEDSNMNSSPFLLALKQSVKQRADRLAAKNSTNV